MVNVSALLTSVMGLKTVQMAVMKPVSCKPSLHRQSVAYISFLCICVLSKNICHPPDIGYFMNQNLLLLPTNTNILYVYTVAHLPEVLKVELC